MGIKITEIELARRIKEIYGDKINSSITNLINLSTKSNFICKEHGIFSQIPDSLLRGHGCQKCGRRKIGIYHKLTLEEFIQKAIAIHGNFYDYSKVIYINSQTKVIIICPIHDEFEQIPASHLQGKNCWKCRNNNITKLQLITKEEFIRRAKLIHGDKYDYSKVVYLGYNVKVIIICPEHGEFEQAPYKHLENRGCSLCKASKGELILNEIFNKYRIEAKPQFKFNKYKKLRYDFYLPELNLLVEFHGGQHFKSIDYFGGITALKELQKRDAFKKSLARDYNIPIIYFTYKHLRMSKEQFEKFVLMVINKIIK